MEEYSQNQIDFVVQWQDSDHYNLYIYGKGVKTEFIEPKENCTGLRVENLQ